ncbi:hypothetical protein KGF56_004331 [Candida oxycetoniae]|uniref:Uncharacterized protein n=1 Tax=Candida oxycetoniae TaxID=497107 RepID=A0AAI9STQ5_9ASCO|nr:uncharacterized protein KGF56_004331 [Candida oxycetoniae]KAI3402870.1 hypothetical protein KGF56_004331 [Candida oxycetoniae]
MEVQADKEITQGRDEVYLSRLRKDIKRVEEHLKQADAAIGSFDETLHESSPIEKQIIALYRTYKCIPYKPDKNDSISTSTTTVVLEKMIQEKKGQLAKAKNDKTLEKKDEFDFAAMVNELQTIRDEKLEAKEVLSKILSREFESLLNEKLQESNNIQVQLKGFLRKVLIKYLALSDLARGQVSDRDKMKSDLLQLSKFFNILTHEEWIEVPSGFKGVVEILEDSNLFEFRDSFIRLKKG